VGRIVRNVWVWLERLAAKRVSNQRAAAVKLAELDARTLRDVGLEAWRSPLGATIALRRYEMRRWSASRLGLY
jgi:hypothetical protein